MFQSPTRFAASLLASAALAMPLAASARGGWRPPVDEAASACAGLAEHAAAPLRREAVESVSPFYQTSRSGRHVWGAILTVRAEPGLTADRLERALRCQIARCAVHPVSEGCPLSVRGARAHVRSSGGRLVVTLWSDYADAGREILARAQTL